MRSVFTFAFVVLTAGVSFGGSEPQSVLVNKEAAAAPCNGGCCDGNCSSGPQLICVGDQCGNSRLYSANSQSSESCRNRLFGGKVVRKTTRTVVKPVRR